MGRGTELWILSACPLKRGWGLLRGPEVFQQGASRGESSLRQRWGPAGECVVVTGLTAPLLSRAARAQPPSQLLRALLGACLVLR